MGQRIHWKHDDKRGGYINVHQNVAIDELQGINFDKNMTDDTPLTPQTHTAHRSVLGQMSWSQSQTQFHIGYQFSRCASRAASPTLAPSIRQSEPFRSPFVVRHASLFMQMHPIANHEDKSSQRAHVICLAEERDLRQGSSNSKGSLVDYEAHNITATTMPTTVAELPGLMRCYGSSLFLRGLWSDITGEIVDVHIQADANNLVTTASTARQPEQKETMHLSQMLRKESNSGQMHYLAHVRSEDCLADSLSNYSAKADELIKAVLTGNLLNVDAHPHFRTVFKTRLSYSGLRATKSRARHRSLGRSRASRIHVAYWGTWA